MDADTPGSSVPRLAVLPRQRQAAYGWTILEKAAGAIFAIQTAQRDLGIAVHAVHPGTLGLPIRLVVLDDAKRVDSEELVAQFPRGQNRVSKHRRQLRYLDLIFMLFKVIVDRHEMLTALSPAVAQGDVAPRAGICLPQM